MYLEGVYLARFLIILIGAVVAVAAGILAHVLYFGPKSKDPYASNVCKFANGQRFLPVSVIKCAYYAAALFLVFEGIAAFPVSGFSGITTFISTAIFGNIFLRIGYELVMAARKNAGIDTDNNTAEEPKTSNVVIPQISNVQPQYQGPQYQTQYQQPVQQAQPVQPQFQQPVQPHYQQPAPAPVSQPVFQQPAPVQQVQPQQVQQPAPAPAPAPQAAQDFPCPSCGKLLKAGAKFCPYCGKPTV